VGARGAVEVSRVAGAGGSKRCCHVSEGCRCGCCGWVVRECPVGG